MDVEDILKELKQKDNQHFNEFYQLTNRQIFFSSLSIVHTKEIAEDIMQDTYIQFLSHIQNYKLGSNVYSYLSIISRNLSLNYLNKQKKITYNEDVLHQVPVYQEKNNDVTEILNLLDSQEEKEIITYHVILEYKFQEISKIMKKPLGTVLWLYQKAIKKLKERMNSDYENETT